MATGQNPVPSVNIPIPTKIGSKMGGAPTPKRIPLVLTTAYSARILSSGRAEGCDCENSVIPPSKGGCLIDHTTGRRGPTLCVSNERERVEGHRITTQESVSGSLSGSRQTESLVNDLSQGRGCAC